MSTDRKPLASYWAPQHWHIWLGLGLLRLLCLLPHRLLLLLGRGLGTLAWHIAASRRAVVNRNLELCFPDLSKQERRKLAKAHFAALGISVFELGLGRWASDAFHRRAGTLRGVEHLQTALESGRGIIILSAHFTTIEIMGRLLSQHLPDFDAVYRRNRSDFITELLRTGREVSAADTIEKRDIKRMVRSLRNGRAVWYAPDQSYDRKGSEVIEFFGVPSMHTTATSTLARLGKAIVLPYFPRRLENGHYEFTILPPFEQFPSGDDVADTRQYVDALEDHVRQCPEQYFWIHRKFKNLPDTYPDLYADLDASK